MGEGHNRWKRSHFVGENGQRPEHVIRECIQTDCVTGSTTATCARDGFPNIFSPQQKRDRVEYSTEFLKMYENCDPRCLNELVTGDETWLYFLEPLRKAINKAWVQKDGDVPQIGRQCCFEMKVLYTVFFYPGHCATETTQTTQGRKELHGRVLQRLCFFQNWTNRIKKINLTQTCTESNCFMMKHLYTSQSWYKSISPRTLFKLCHTLPISPVWHHAIYFSFPTVTEESLSERKF